MPSSRIRTSLIAYPETARYTMSRDEQFTRPAPTQFDPHPVWFGEFFGFGESNGKKFKKIFGDRGGVGD